MRNKTLVGLLAIPLFALSFSAAAADATGRWKTIDDETGKVVEIVKSEYGPNPLCVKCSGTNKGKPVKGMTILWNLKADGENRWAGGTVLDPAKGKTYKSKAELQAGGGKLDVSGCVAFICRAQTWIRE